MGSPTRQTSVGACIDGSRAATAVRIGVILMDWQRTLGCGEGGRDFSDFEHFMGLATDIEAEVHALSRAQGFLMVVGLDRGGHRPLLGRSLAALFSASCESGVRQPGVLPGEVWPQGNAIVEAKSTTAVAACHLSGRCGRGV